MTEIHLPDRGPSQEFWAEPGIQVVPLLTPTLPPATHTNCVVIGTDQVVIIDPASPYEEEQARLLTHLKSRGAEVLAIWLTHHHADHTGGVQALRTALDVPVLAHPATAERIQADISVDDALFDGDRTTLGELEIEALHTPGHARGHLAFREVTSRTLVAGDLVAGQGTIIIDPPEGDMSDYLATLGRLVQENVGAIIPAHGPLIDDGETKLLNYIGHREVRERQIAEALQKKANKQARPLDLVPEIYPEVPPVFHPLAARQVLAHLLKLEQEGQVDRPDGGSGVPGTPVYMATGQENRTPDVSFRWIGASTGPNTNWF